LMALAIGFFFIWPRMAPVSGGLLWLALGGIPLGLGYLLLQNLLLGIQAVRAYNLIELATKILTIFLVFLIILLGWTSAPALYAVGLIALGVGLGLAYRKLRAKFDKGPEFSWKMFKENLHYGLKAYFNFFAAFLVLRIDLLMVKYWLGPEQAGYYSVAAALADLLYLLPMAVGTIFFPMLSTMDAQAEQWRLTRQWVIRVGLLMLPMAFIGAVLARPGIGLVFGKSFLPAAAPLAILCLAMVVYGMNNIVSNYFSARGLPPFSVYVWILGLMVNVALNGYTIPRYGIGGAAWASLVSYGIVFILQMIYAQRKGPTPKERGAENACKT
jgi:O-antigen/teichoic acid export membrane protein